MSTILEFVKDHELRRFNAGDTVLEQGTKTGKLFFLCDGAVEVIKDDVQVATVAQPGAVFGELSAFLGGPHTATVRTSQPSAFFVVDDPRTFLESNPRICVLICELLAQRLDALNKYLVNVKHQYEGHDHLGMVDSVLETLMRRQKVNRVRPSESTIHKGEFAD